MIRLGLSEVRNLGTSWRRRRSSPASRTRTWRTLPGAPRLPVAALEALALAGVFDCFGRQQAGGTVGSRGRGDHQGQTAPGTTLGMAAPPLPQMTAAEMTFCDLWATGTYGTHPIEHIRPVLDERGVLPAARLTAAGNGRNVIVGGLVTHRQQPGTARGVVFLSLEDETGMANIICPPTYGSASAGSGLTPAPCSSTAGSSGWTER